MSLPHSPLVGAEESAPTGFRVTPDNFEGPLDLLLQLPTRHKLAVTAGGD